MGWLLLLVLGCTVLLSGCGEQAQEKDDTVSKDTVPVLPPTPDIIEVPGNDLPASSDPKGDDTSSPIYKYPFLVPMVYCSPDGWNEYWRTRMYPELRGNGEIPDIKEPFPVPEKEVDHIQYELLANSDKEFAPYPNPYAIGENKWFKMIWNIQDDTFFSPNSSFWTVDKIKEILDKENECLTEMQPNMPKLIYNCCNEAAGLDFNNSFTKYYKDIINKNGPLTLSPLVILATFKAEHNFCRTDDKNRWDKMTHAEKLNATDATIKNCLGVNGASTCDLQIRKGSEIYIVWGCVGRYLNGFGYFNPDTYMASEDGERSPRFKQLMSMFTKNGNGGLGFDEGAISESYGAKYNVNSKTPGEYIEDSMGLGSFSNWLQGKPDTFKYFFSGYPFLPSNLSLFSRIMGFNGWLFYPLKNKYVDQQGMRLTQKWLNIFMLYFDQYK